MEASDTVPDEELVICRCEGTTLRQIRRCLDLRAAYTVDEVKKLTRCGMGACQGRTCAGLLDQVIRRHATALAVDAPYRSRPPVRPVPLGNLASGADDFAEPAGPVSVVMLRKPAENAGGVAPPDPEPAR
jgi:bacterioferritin-associated ferredoxin